MSKNIIKKFAEFESSLNLDSTAYTALKSIKARIEESFNSGEFSELANAQVELQESELNFADALLFKTLNFGFTDGTAEYICIISLDIKSMSGPQVDSVSVQMKKYTDSPEPQISEQNVAPDDIDANLLLKMIAEVE